MTEINNSDDVIDIREAIEFHAKEAAGHNRAWKRELRNATVCGQDRARWHKEQEAKHQAEMKALMCKHRDQ